MKFRKNRKGNIKMKYSFFTVGAQEYGLEEILNKLKQYGYDGVEWRVKALDISSLDGYGEGAIDLNFIEENAIKIKQLCEKKGMEIIALATYLRPDQKPEIEKVLRAARLMNCRQIRIGTPLYQGDIPYPQLFGKTVRDIEALIPAAKENGVRINVEIHFGKLIPSCSAAYRLVSNFDPSLIGVIHDAGNMVMEGYENWQMGLELLGPYLAHVHVKNYKWFIKQTLDDGTFVWQSEPESLKKGQANFREILKALKHVDYDGYLSFEDFSPKETAEEKLKNNIIYLKNIYNEISNL